VNLYFVASLYITISTLAKKYDQGRLLCFYDFLTKGNEQPSSSSPRNSCSDWQCYRGQQQNFMIVVDVFCSSTGPR